MQLDHHVKRPLCICDGGIRGWGNPQRSFSLLSYCRAFTQRSCNALCMASVIFTSKKEKGLTQYLFFSHPPPDLMWEDDKDGFTSFAQEPWEGGAFFTRSCRSVLNAQRNDIFPRGHRRRWYGDELVWMATVSTLESQLLFFYGGRTQDPKSDLAKAQ